VERGFEQQFHQNQHCNRSGGELMKKRLILSGLLCAAAFAQSVQVNRGGSQYVDTVGLGRQSTAGTGGVTANLMVVQDSANPGGYITASTSGDCRGGIAHDTVTAGNPFYNQTIPGFSYVATAGNAVTAGHIVTCGATTAGTLDDSGQTNPSLATGIIVGRALTSASSGSTFSVVYFGNAGSAGVSVGGSPGNLQYNNAGALGGIANTSSPNAGEIANSTAPNASSSRCVFALGAGGILGSTNGTLYCGSFPSGTSGDYMSFAYNNSNLLEIVESGGTLDMHLGASASAGVRLRGGVSNNLQLLDGSGNAGGNLVVNGKLGVSNAGGTNFYEFQTTGLTRADNQALPAGPGFGVMWGDVSLSAQTAAISSTALVSTVAPTGLYQISGTLTSTVSCATKGPAVANLSISYTNENGAVASQVVPVYLNSGSGYPVTPVLTGVPLGDTTGQIGAFVMPPIWSITGNAINYSVSYTACTSGTGTYALRLSAELRAK
jgi:hypothetical protein